MTLTTILCPLDFSAASVALVAYAAALAVGTGAELRLLYVQEPAMPLAVGVEAELSVHRAAAQAAGANRVSTNMLKGEAAPEIVAEARRQHADLIVIGAHGQTGLSRFLMGNTAEVVVRTAPCPTLLVRE
ncbi:universal stress protein [Hymenobacter sp. HMF4947]|uniref:Universal stress protein n=1 Tax=Hymenobacter ginkgonis TaxID=2682976 RepID=A0A7K1TBV4_9BACT|nr:universal stress protein [Hymenobacter ginkgonis]MVN75884.1 universal stress protein [Hymenobacter ginkgonis]